MSIWMMYSLVKYCIGGHWPNGHWMTYTNEIHHSMSIWLNSTNLKFLVSLKVKLALMARPLRILGWMQSFYRQPLGYLILLLKLFHSESFCCAAHFYPCCCWISIIPKKAMIRSRAENNPGSHKSWDMWSRNNLRIFHGFGFKVKFRLRHNK